MRDPEALSAVLNTINYVCECVEDAPNLALTALLAGTTITCRNVLHQGETINNNETSPDDSGDGSINPDDNMQSPSNNQTNKKPLSPMYPLTPQSTTSLTSTGSFFKSTSVGETQDSAGGEVCILISNLEALHDAVSNIVGLKRSYVAHFVKVGIFPSLLCPAFEQLFILIENTPSIQSNRPSNDSQYDNDEYGHIMHKDSSLLMLNPNHLVVYNLLLDLLVELQTHSRHIAEEIRLSGLNVLIRNLIKSNRLSIDLTKHLLSIPEVLSKSETTHLEESMQVRNSFPITLSSIFLTSL